MNIHTQPRRAGQDHRKENRSENRTDNRQDYRSNGHDSEASGSTASTLIAGAAGFGLGLLASIGRRAMVQAPTYTAGDWFEGLKAEHKIARKLMESLAETTEEDMAKRPAMLFELQHAIGKHNVQEEYVVYCVLRERGERGAADQLHGEHGELKQGLFELEMICKEKRGGFHEKLREVRAAFENHVREEEEDVFPRLHAMLSAEEQRKLTNRMNREGFKVA